MSSLSVGLRLGVQKAAPEVPEEPAQGVLEIYDGAALGYSFDLLDFGYEGACVRIRRSSDDTLLDIGFVDGVFDTDGLAAFVGAGDGFVHTWYCQVEGAPNAVQTTLSEQPILVDNGTLLIENGKPAMRFDGNNDYLEIEAFDFDRQRFYILAKTEPDSTSTHGSIFSQYDSGENERVFDLELRNTGVVRIWMSDDGLSLDSEVREAGDYVAAPQIIEWQHDGETESVWIDGASQTVEADSEGDEVIIVFESELPMRIGANEGGHFYEGTISELLFYDVVQSDRADLYAHRVAYYEL